MKSKRECQIKAESKLADHVRRAELQAKNTRRQVIITVVINPDAPNQYFTGTISGTLSGTYEMIHHR